MCKICEAAECSIMLSTSSALPLTSLVHRDVFCTYTVSRQMLTPP